MNFFDTLARIPGGNPKLMVSYRIFVILNWFRLFQVFVFLYIAYWSGSSLDGKFGDVLKILNVIVFAGLNGYL